MKEALHYLNAVEIMFPVSTVMLIVAVMALLIHIFIYIYYNIYFNIFKGILYLLKGTKCCLIHDTMDILEEA